MKLRKSLYGMKYGGMVQFTMTKITVWNGHTMVKSQITCHVIGSHGELLQGLTGILSFYLLHVYLAKEGNGNTNGEMKRNNYAEYCMNTPCGAWYKCYIPCKYKTCHAYLFISDKVYMYIEMKSINSYSNGNDKHCLFKITLKIFKMLLINQNEDMPHAIF